MGRLGSLSSTAVVGYTEINPWNICIYIVFLLKCPLRPCRKFPAKSYEANTNSNYWREITFKDSGTVTSRSISNFFNEEFTFF